MVRVSKIYYLIHNGDDEPRLYGIHLILDSAKALFDRLTQDDRMNAHITLTACSMSEHGIVIDRKLMFSFHREMGFTVDHSVMSIIKVDESALDLKLKAPQDGSEAKPLADDDILSLSIDEYFNPVQ
jgi:hypothetical protein